MLIGPLTKWLHEIVLLLAITTQYYILVRLVFSVQWAKKTLVSEYMPKQPSNNDSLPFHSELLFTSLL